MIDDASMMRVPESLIERPDGLSSALSLLRTHGEILCRSEFRAPWSIGFGERAVHVHLVERGAMIAQAVGREPIVVPEGALLFVGPHTPYVIASDAATRPVAIADALAHGLVDGRVLRFGGDGAQVDVLCAQFSLDGMLADRLASHLPKLFVTEPDASATFAWMRETIRMLVEEVRAPRAGSGVMIVRLLDLLLIQLLRAWSADEPARLQWLTGLDDPRIGHALAAMHADPARPWSLDALAAIAGMGRTAFAQRFVAAVGETPLRYLAHWRLHRASDLLRAGAGRIGDVAAQVGYGSEAAFTRAFRARYGIAPGALRRRR